jgi:hypothetical protein
MSMLKRGAIKPVICFLNFPIGSINQFSFQFNRTYLPECAQI